MLRAWRKLACFQERSSLRGWLYAVATRCCLDAIAQRDRRALPMDLGPASRHVVLEDSPLTDIAWLGPYPDARLGDPSDLSEEREAVELALVATLQHLPGNQRAALLLFDVVGFSAAEIAGIMDTSVASVNSALQRGRAMVAARVPPRTQQETLRALGDAQVRRIANGYARALEQGDIAGLVGLLTVDVTWSMPPLPHWYAGLSDVRDFAQAVPMRCGTWRHVIDQRQRPARCRLLSPTGRRGRPHRLVDQRPHPAGRPDRRDHVVHRRGELRAARAPRPAALTPWALFGPPESVRTGGASPGSRHRHGPRS